jgi:hypothetical protein
VRGRSRLRRSLARAACGWVFEGVTPFLPDIMLRQNASERTRKELSECNTT